MDVAAKCDVVYQTRTQKERFGERVDLYEEARGKYIVDLRVLNLLKKHAVVMHPLPRLDEVNNHAPVCTSLLYQNTSSSEMFTYILPVLGR